MKYALLVAIREYIENAKTKGFWIGIMIFPVMILIAIQVPRYLEKATPTRYFVLVDQSGEYAEVVDRGLTRYHIQKKALAFVKYFKKYNKSTEARQKNAEEIPANQEEKEEETVEKVIRLFTDSSPEQLDRLATRELWQEAAKKVDPFLREDRPEFDPPGLKFVRVPAPGGLDLREEPAALGQALKPYLLGHDKAQCEGNPVDLFAAVIIPPDVKGRTAKKQKGKQAVEKAGGIEYWSANLADQDLQKLIENAVNEEFRRNAFIARGVKPETVRDVQKSHIPFNAKNPKKEAGKEDVSMADRIRQWAPIGFVYLLWIAIFTVSQMLLNNTIEEKSNRIIEVLLSSVTSHELMMGKLLGIAAVGLTMTGAWIATLLVVLNLYNTPEVQVIGQILTVLNTSNLLPLFAVYFLFGYLFYSGIFLAIGSICNTIKEAQNFMGPMMMIMMVPLLAMFFIPKDPNGTLATALSWIPLYTPFVMMNRAAADPPLVDQIGTVILMIGSAVAMLWLSAKIFRIGILRTGQPPRLVELFRWIKNPA